MAKALCSMNGRLGPVSTNGETPTLFNIAPVYQIIGEKFIIAGLLVKGEPRGFITRIYKRAITMFE